ncbi:hypothetical protein MIND_00947700 [Mycena indigotica]|uniref:Transmembrane protein n=1 Tax=Mycena indigotica TaxID=2126181 RepID=A0A8H6SF04_9AGAR|nr:uncharacterized protein MIND_00947700 [Mycena indigotica]KAF7297147.1 hypothetical protein MIND_00947700 [Mycena indigotica]
MSLVIVDDQSSLLHYSGGSWEAGASYVFRFNGTSTSLHGGYDAGTSCSGLFTIDANATTFTSPNLTTVLNQQVLWSSGTLADTEHILNYTVTSCAPSSTGHVWFDYLLYSPSINASTDDLLFFIDDTDPRLTYTGNWTAQTGNDGDFQLTSHGGSQGASFRFEFEGTLVSLHGRIGDDTNGANTKASFSIDGAPSVTFSSPSQGSITFNQALFQSDTLSPGKHTLVATSQSGSLWVDYLLLQPNPSTQNLTPVSHSSLTIGEIIGMAIGAVVLALIIALAVLFRRRLFQRSPSRKPSRNHKSRLVIGAPDVSTFTHVSHTPWVPSRSFYPATNSSASVLTHSTSNPFDTPPTSPHAKSFVTASSSSLSGPPVTALDTFSLGQAAPPPSNTTPRTSTITATSASGSGGNVPFSVSATGHRRHPSLSGDGDSVAELKRRQQAHLAAQSLAVPSYDELEHAETASIGAVSHSSLRPLPRIPPAGPSGQASSSNYDYDDLPPVYTVQ